MRSTQRIIFVLTILLGTVFISLYWTSTQFSTRENGFQGRNKYKHILMWTSIFGKRSLELEKSCDLISHCTVSYNRSTLNAADAVVFHLFDIDVADLPDENDDTNGRLNVLLTHESYLNSIPILRRLPDNYFHWIMTNIRSAHVPFVYGGYWTSPDVAKLKGFSPKILTVKPDDILRGKARTVFWTVSNCVTSSKREIAVNALQRYIDVDIFGKCASNESMRVACPLFQFFNCDFFNSYYFVIIAENSICTDYVTEKYWNRYHLPVVPIVMRRRVYENMLPPNSFIAMDDFDGPKALADHLNFLIRNPPAYLKLFEWRNRGWARARWNAPGYRIGLCNLCDKLLKRDVDTQVDRIADAHEWLRNASQCEGGEFAERWISVS